MPAVVLVKTTRLGTFCYQQDGSQWLVNPGLLT